jgi:cardiolipin synthase A/B
MSGRAVAGPRSWRRWSIICVLALVLGVGLAFSGCTTTASKAQSSSRLSTTTTATASSAVPATVPAPTTTTSTAAAPSALSLLVEPQAGYTPLYTFMSSARQSLDMTMYELSDPAADQVLIADHQRGVRVRVLLDKDFSGGTVNQPAFSTLTAAGVSVAWTNDSEIFHQKTITVDDATSAIMTGNLTSKYYATTRDFVVMDTQGPDVAAIESTFTADWAGAKPAPAPSGTDLVWSPGSEPALAALLTSAAHSLVVENEEMDSSTIEAALESDARRGVDVTVVMTTDSDWDSAFAQLESAGVHVVLYPDTSSALYIHAKAIDVDSAKAFLGSENFSTASLDYNRELGLLTSSAGVLGPLNSTLASDIAGAQAQPPTSAPSPAPITSPAPVAPPAAAGCTPITNEGGCYKSGEYCRADDHGTTGRAEDGATITCEDEGGTWYWESA